MKITELGKKPTPMPTPSVSQKFESVQAPITMQEKPKEEPNRFSNVRIQDVAYKIVDDIIAGNDISSYPMNLIAECMIWWRNQAQSATLNCQYLHGQLTLYEVIGKMRQKKNPEFDDFANSIEKSLNILKR